MSTTREKIAIALKKDKCMKEEEGKEIIRKLGSNPDALKDVVRWILANDHDKMLKKCRVNIADDCEGIGRASGFHGRRCRACSRQYNRIRCQSLRLKTMGDKPSKRSDSDDESSESECEKPKKRKRISFKKGTKL